MPPLQSISTFTAIFGDQWQALPPALKLHYVNRPYSRDRTTVQGKLTIRMSPLLRALSPVLEALGMLTPWEGTNVPCTVYFFSEPDSRAFIFQRHFAFPGRAPYVFRSRLVPVGGHAVIEYMACGLGWVCTYSFADDQVQLRHKGYVWHVFGMDIPLPLATLLMGRGTAWERAISDTGFAMHMELSGGLLGALYSYAGEFAVTEVSPHNA